MWNFLKIYNEYFGARKIHEEHVTLSAFFCFNYILSLNKRCKYNLYLK